MTSFRILATVVLIGFLSCRCDAITNFVVWTRLYGFTGGADGGLPESWLIQASDGNFYGTTSQGGANNTGTVFRLTVGVTNIVGTITNLATVTTLYSFTGGDDGATPIAGLFQGSDSNFYGMTTRGGVNDTGTVFQITTAGTLTTLHGFTGGADGGYPLGGVIQGSDGNLYGTTSQGGANSSGTVFQITSDGTFTTLYSFPGGTNGAIPKAGLVQATDGNFYGTTSIGGSNTYGTVFSISSNGAFTSIYQFTRADGRYPAAALIQSFSDGYFYGTTPFGGDRGYGTAFKVSSQGTFTTLFDFGGGDGERPGSSLLQAKDGLFYGTTFLGGYGYGTLFQMNSNGVFNTSGLNTLGRFLGDVVGGIPYAGLVQGVDNYFYGTTGFGGPGLHGTVFRFTAFPGGTYTGLATQTNALTTASSGFLNLNLRFTGYFTGKLKMGNTSSAIRGTLDPSGTTTNVVPPRGPNPLQIIFQLNNVGGGTNEIDGTISNGVFTSEFLTDAAGVFVNTNPCPQFGRFTFIIAPANTNDTTVPQGFGYGTLTVAKLGRLHMRGVLGDGTSFQANGPISGIGTFPIYDLLYDGKLGSVLGRITFPATNAFGATLDWFKPPTHGDHFYRDGFTTSPTLQGAAYITPSKKNGLTVAGTAQVTLAGGNLSSNLVKDVVIDSNGVATVTNPGPDNLSFSITPSTGLLSGGFTNLDINKIVFFTGYLLQTNQLQTSQIGAGLFFGTNQTGYVLIQPAP
ncbi:MAG: choice-of-anchor tandem repeat GloVer-containing protein [Verrucomicrobiia bacterium]